MVFERVSHKRYSYEFMIFST